VKGQVFRRCGCEDPASGKQLGASCPKLRSPSHGSWYYLAELRTGPNGKRRREKRGGFATKREAQAALIDVLDRVEKRSYVAVGKQTVGDYLDSWLAGKVNLRPTTRRSYQGHLDLFLKPGLGHLRFSDLTDAHIEALYQAMRQLGRDEGKPSALLRRLIDARKGPAQSIGATSILRVHATLRSALNSAVKRKKLPFNPASYVELEPARRPKPVVWTTERVAEWQAAGRRPKVAVWTAEQTGAFLDHAYTDRLYALYHLIAFRGLRRGEAVGARWTDLDLDAAALAVAQQIVQVGWRTEVGEPKSGSARVIPLDAITVAVLKAHRARQNAERLAAGSGWVDSGLIFTREDGAVLHPDYVTRHFEWLVRNAGLPPIRLHDLRHGAATLALAAGTDIKVVQELLGHSTSVLTRDTYTSVLPEVARAAAEAIAGIVPLRWTDAEKSGTRSAPGTPENKSEKAGFRTKGQVRQGAPPGTRTPNPRIKSPLLCQLS
jgi:integrase